jgi:hypothetical protein
MQHPIPAIPSIHCNALGEKRTDRALANDILLACSVAASGIRGLSSSEIGMISTTGTIASTV